MPPPLCRDEKRELLKLARASIIQVIVKNEIPESPSVKGRLQESGGAFVTLFCRGRLRGCLGLVGQKLSLAETVVQAAVSASRNDPRFAPLAAEELNDLVIEISLLSEPAPITPEKIEIGKHGLLIVRDAKRGLLLPQVPVERSWTAARFLEETCRKAGLAADAWRDPQTTVLAFTAEVFSEKKFADEREKIN